MPKDLAGAVGGRKVELIATDAFSFELTNLPQKQIDACDCGSEMPHAGPCIIRLMPRERCAEADPSSSWANRNALGRESSRDEPGVLF